jgi:DNA-binding transcriptional LysR family regulator
VAPKGRLRVTSSVMFGRLHVARVATDFIVKYPAVQVDLLLLDRVVDLVEEGVDAGVRIAQLPDSSLVAIQVGQTRRVVCASPAYLNRMGVPKVPADLARHRCVNFTGLASGSEWNFGDGADALRVTANPVLVTNQIDAALDACVRGVGVGRFLCYQVQALLDSGKLKRVLGEYEPASLPIQVIYPHGRLPSSNVRAFVDWAVPRLRARLKAQIA